MLAFIRRFLFAAACLFVAANSLILLEDIDELTGTTWTAISCLEAAIVADIRGPPQHASTSYHNAEETAAKAINMLDEDLARRLSVPMRDIYIPDPSCRSVARSYVDFMTQTTRLLVLLLERKPNPFPLTHESEMGYNVFDEITWLQTLWASRTAKGNDQDFSFIEQRQTLYRATGCFSDMKQLLRRDVEVVELLNDLIDAYNPANGQRQELVK